MVFFRPVSIPDDETAHPPLTGLETNDFAPLAVAATSARNREPYVVANTLPAGDELTQNTPAGTVWRAGLIAQVRNPHPAGELAERVLCADSDREQWLRLRRRGITASDAARLATPASVRSVVNDKRSSSSFTGNAFTEYGKRREPEIQKWVRAEYGIHPCGLLIHAAGNERHLATPDGFVQNDGQTLLAEIKTTNKRWSRIPRNYLRQVYWQQYVVGAERTLFVWEHHENFVLQDEHPRAVWIDRDETEIARLIALANQVLEYLDLP